MSLNEVSKLAHALVESDAVVERINSELKAAKERVRFLKEESIPGVMQELGIEKMKLDNGKTISIAEDVYASIPAAMKHAAHQWLVDHDFGGLIKTDVSVQFGKGERDDAVDLAKDLLGKGFQADVKEGVHAQTLKAFLREQLKAGTDVPLDLFGARPVWTTKIKN